MPTEITKARYPLYFKNTKFIQYPLLKRFILLGLLIGTLFGTITFQPVVGFSIFSLFVIVGLVWRSDEPPILPFCLVYQWVFVIAGYFYYLYFGFFPISYFNGNPEKAVFLSLFALIVIALSIRIGIKFVNTLKMKKINLSTLKNHYNIRKLFWLVIAVNSVDYVVQMSPAAISFSASQIIWSLLLFKFVLLFLLFIEIFNQKKEYSFGAIAFGFAILPQFASMMSDFKEIIFILLIAVASIWRPWVKLPSVRKTNRRVIATLFFGVVILLLMALFWEGVVKKTWRPAYMRGEVQGNPIKRVTKFGTFVINARSDFNISKNTEMLASRLSSSIGFFSLVLDRVPVLIPYENGKMLYKTFLHTIKPRILFPDKPVLPVDSLLVRKYAGVYVAGEELQTSVGLGYIPQFYIDFGIPGIIVLSLFLGLLIGVIYRGLIFFSPSYNLYISAVVILFLYHFTQYETELTKLVGGMVMNTIIFAFVLYFIGPYIHRMLMVKSRTIK